MPAAQVSPETFKFGSGDLDFQPFGFSSSTKDCAAGEWTKLYVLDILKGLGALLGRGNSEAPQFAEGFAGLRLVSDAAAAQATGDFKVDLETTQGRTIETLVSGDLEEYDLFTGAAGSGSQKDRDKRRPFARTDSSFTTHEYQLALYVNVDSAITVDDAEAETKMLMEGYKAEKTR